MPCFKNRNTKPAGYPAKSPDPRLVHLPFLVLGELDAALPPLLNAVPDQGEEIG
jgi:hypothetical protein